MVGEKYAVIIAVEHYADLGISAVTYAGADARAMSDVLVALGFRLANQHVLVDHEATKSRIDSRLRRTIEAALPDDEIVIYYAGHGFAEADHNYLTCYDTETGDLVQTSLHLQRVLGFVGGSRCPKISVFLDSCHSGSTLLETGDRGLIQDMSEQEIRSFFRDAEYLVCFSSCKAGEKSYPSAAMNHGIWTNQLLEALDGSAPQAIERDGMITAGSLQSYLSTTVPLKVREAHSGLRTQTPTMYGAATREFLIADVGALVAARQLASRAGGFPKIGRFSFGHSRSMRVKSLSGYQRHHFVPDNTGPAATAFVQSVSQDEVSAETDRWHRRIRDGLGYSRRDLSVDAATGVATIFTPDFSLEISIAIDPEDPSLAIVNTELVNITNPMLIESEQFGRTFAGVFDTVEFQFNDQDSVERWVDQVEGLSDARVRVDYPHDLSFCRVSADGLPFEIQVQPGLIRFEFSRKESPADLLDQLAQGSAKMLEAHQMPILEA